MVATVATDPEVFHGNAVPVPGLRRHVLDLDDFTAEEIAATLDNAAAMRAVLARDIKKVPAPPGPRHRNPVLRGQYPDAHLL